MFITLSITINDLELFEYENSSILLIFPPNKCIAAFALSTSSAQSPDLYETNFPPIFTNGRQYSDKVDRFATALDTAISYDARYVLSLAISSALP